MPTQRKVRKIQYFFRSIWNTVLYRNYHGQSNIPESFETIWIKPNDVSLFHNSFRRRYSGRIIDGDWDLRAKHIDTHEKIKCCKYKFISGVSWKESGIIQLMLSEIEKRGKFDDCHNLDDINERYRKHDLLFEDLKNGQRYKPMREINSNNYREHGGVLIHVGRKGQLIFGGAGCHRMAISQTLNLALIPAQIGVCHPLAVKNGYLKAIRNKKPDVFK